MLLTQRVAERRLATIGLARRQAHQVLAAGLAGRPEVTTSSLLYDAADVEALLGRAPMDEEEILTHCPHGLFVARRAAERIDQLSDGWGVGVITGIWIGLRVDRHGPLPLVATVGGFVTLGAEIVAVRTRVGDDPSRPTTTLDLAPAGDWVGALRERRILRGPGREWSLVGFGPPGGPRVRPGLSWEDDPP